MTSNENKITEAEIRFGSNARIRCRRSSWESDSHFMKRMHRLRKTKTAYGLHGVVKSIPDIWIREHDGKFVKVGI